MLAAVRAALAEMPGMREAILSKARNLGLAPGRVIRDSVGLRPYRRAVRVEREGRIVHNYGHGGAGYTLAWGCAEEVAALVGGKEAR